MEQDKLIPHLFRTEYSKITSVLCKHLGVELIDVAEDIASDTFLIATETWGMKGLPENPTAWLYAVAKNKARDFTKRQHVFSGKVSEQMKQAFNNSYELEIDLSPQNILDSQLQMMFAICHPSLAKESQIGLALRILCGFGIEEIASAFLTGKETINKRLFRAKEKLRELNVSISMPSQSVLTDRLESVVSTLYLLFNEGYYSSSHLVALQKDLCREAMRLTHSLTQLEVTNKPIVNALLSLMCFHASRFDARMGGEDEIVLYEEQDPALWNEELIARGQHYLKVSAQGNEISRFHIEAGIAFWHTVKSGFKEKWENIFELYNQLLAIHYSPVAALNRAYTILKVKGSRAALDEAGKLDVPANHLYHGLMGHIYKEIDVKKASQHFSRALQLAKTDSDKKAMKSQLLSLGKI